MKVTRRSIYSGVVRTKDLPITHKQINQYESGISIDICMSNLSQADKIFFISGIDDEDWDESTMVVGSKQDK